MTEQELLQELNNPKNSLIEGYLDLQEFFEKKYGKNTIVLIEVGSFFEVYGVDNKEETVGKPKEVAEMLNLQLTRRSKSIPENSRKNPLLAGFPIASFDRYVNKITSENKYTLVIIKQRGIPPKITRYVDSILSPGVNFEYRNDHDDNYLTSLAIDQNAGIYSVGYSAIDVSTGKTLLLELHGSKDDHSYALDEVFSLLHKNKTSEIILSPKNNDINIDEILEYLELEHEQNLKIIEKKLSVTYQNELFSKTYIIKSFLSPIEFLDLERKPLTSESLAHLIEFIIEHDYKTIENLSEPTHLENAKYLYLGNNPLEQLSILSRNKQEYTVFDLVNKTNTPIGKRLLKNRLACPITNKNEIEKRYKLAEKLIPHTDFITGKLRSIYDLERLKRRIQTSRLHPFEINFLFDSFEATLEISEYLKSEQINTEGSELENKQNEIGELVKQIQNHFNLEKTNKVTIGDIADSLFPKGYNASMDALLEEKEMLESKLECIRDAFLNFLEEITGKREESFIAIKELDKEGHYLNLTKSRYALIEHCFAEKHIVLEEKVYPLSLFKRKVQTTNVKITAEVIDEISEDLTNLKKKIKALSRELYIEELESLSNKYTEIIDFCSKKIAEIDVAISTGKLKSEYNFCVPNLLPLDSEEKILEIESLRHPLIEKLEDRGIYIPNDVYFGDAKFFENKENYTEGKNINGVLLYGINSSGKSSLMKSIGIAVVLAQAGLFVPAKSLRMRPFTELFTRIIAKDNLERGLSSFAVEMVELKNIFTRSTENSLILGDEISHGTETLSAISIVSATIERLLEKNTFFLFTTHLHQLQNLKAIKNAKNLKHLHMKVHYDKDKDALVFDRKLQEGSGSSIYGLEFAQSLHMDKKFLDKALKTRKNLAGDYEELELLTSKQKSKYNKNLFLTSCAICKAKVEDTHHIKPQEIADEFGHIDHHHKNHKFNLLPICKNCHDKIHKGKLHVNGFIMTSKGLELGYEEHHETRDT